MAGAEVYLEQCDLLLTGGTVVDPTARAPFVADVAISGDRIVEIAPNIRTSAGRQVNCRGQYVTPGLIDYHTHIFNGVSNIGAPVAEACLQRGVVLAVDAGSAGAWTFPAFRRYVVEAAPLRVFSFLNVSALGIINMSVGELRLLDYLQPDAAIETARANSDVVRGFKARLSEHVVGPSSLPALRLARAIADATELPLMIHIGETHEELPAIIDLLRPGDIVSHCYTGLSHGILDDDDLLPAVREARSAGIIFDPAHGASNFSYAVARRALDLGFLPDTISSDNSLRNWRGPVFDLVTTMSKFLALGMTISQVVERVTARPAALLGADVEGYGKLATGGPAEVTVLRLTDEEYDLPDAMKQTLRARRLEPLLTIHAGQVIEATPWRGLA